MNKEHITVTIDPETGETEVEAHGFKDGKCRVATEPFETALGVVRQRKIKAPEQVKSSEKTKVGK